jgi:chromosome transmission fidelity protein 1
LAAAEVVVLPYNLLLSKSSRQAVGLSLKECLVLIDEAHNLPEAIRSLNSCQLPLSSAKAALDQLEAYINRYAERLAGRNLYYLGQLRKCIKAFVHHLHKDPQKAIFKSAGEFLMDLKLDNVNFFKITSYLDRSRLPQKILGFADSTKWQIQNNKEFSRHISALSIVHLFISKLTSTAKLGKIITEWPKVDIDSRSDRMTVEPCLRFVALDPSIHFQNVVDESLATALVGGTLRPFSHVAAELLDPTFLLDATQADSVVESSNHDSFITYSTPILTTFSCDHIVPKSNVLLRFMSTGPSDRITLDFRHQSRGRHDIIDELGLSIVRIAQVVPAGMVIFLPSYSYEAQLVRRWKDTGLWNTLNQTKRIHREPKRSSDAETVLDAYCNDAYKSGSVLLSVVAGKMSEGINFSDDMARCVMVVGLPYPDITDPELKEKMDTIDSTPGGISGREYYHNLCMRAVNQSVGRAIRHANDYASILLADQRYSMDHRVQASLPSWLTRNPDLNSKSFHSTLCAVESFFATKKNMNGF